MNTNYLEAAEMISNEQENYCCDAIGRKGYWKELTEFSSLFDPGDKFLWWGSAKYADNANSILLPNKEKKERQLARSIALLLMHEIVNEK